MTDNWPMKEWPAPPPPAPPEEPQPIAPPAPDPPTEGWWLDPEDSRRIRYHDGRGWTDRVGRSTAPRPGLPAHQAWFALGGGPEGIPTGSPLAPGEGHFLARTTVWALAGVLIVGLLVGTFGIGALQEGMLAGPAAVALIALGSVLFFGPMAIGIVSAWRAGFAIRASPVTRPSSSARWAPSASASLPPSSCGSSVTGSASTRGPERCWRW